MSDANTEKYRELEAATDRIWTWLFKIQDHNAEGQPTRSRHLSLAITHIEDGLLRLERALVEGPKTGSQR